MISTRLRQAIIIFLGSVGYLGFVPVASGTVTVAVVGIPLFFGLHRLAWGWYAVLTALFILIAVPLSTRGDEILGEKDSSRLVVDEIAGYLVATCGLPFTWPIALASFLIERALDIAKIPPANVIEKRVPGGWGVVLDDVVAGAYTLLIMRILIAWKPDLMLGESL